MIALRNVLLLLLGISIPMVAGLGASLWIQRDYLSCYVVYALWAYVILLMADGYFYLKNGGNEND